MFINLLFSVDLFQDETHTISDIRNVGDGIIDELIIDSIPIDIKKFTGVGVKYSAVNNREYRLKGMYFHAKVSDYPLDTIVHFTETGMDNFKNGKPHGKSIESTTDIYSFIFDNMQYNFAPPIRGKFPDSIVRGFEDGTYIRHEYYELKEDSFVLIQEIYNEDGIYGADERGLKNSDILYSRTYFFEDKKDFYSKTRPKKKCLITWSEARFYKQLSEDEFIANKCFSNPDSIAKSLYNGLQTTTYFYKNKMRLPPQARAMYDGKSIVNWSFSFSNGTCFKHSVYMGEL